MSSVSGRFRAVGKRQAAQSERGVQRSILAMLGVAFPSVLAHHSPNGGHLAGDQLARFKQVGALKGDGMKTGFPDLLVVWAGGIAFLEVKRPKYSPSDVRDDQIRLHAQLRDMGFPVAIVTSPAEAFTVLKEQGAPTNLLDWREA